MIEKIIVDIILLIVLFFFSMIVHELGHYITAKQQGLNPTIELWWFYIAGFHIPSLICEPNGTLKDKDSFYLSGGMYSFMVLLLISVFLSHIDKGLGIIGFSITLMQFIYGWYEMKFIHKLSRIKYMMWHYVLYITTILGVLFLGRAYLP